MTSHKRAAEKIVEILDSDFLRALTEPARLTLLKVLLLEGAADVATLAEQLPQDRSVISRHLQMLEKAGVVAARKDGRHRIYSIDGASFLATLEGMLATVKSLVPACCPSPSTETDLVHRRTSRRRAT